MLEFPIDATNAAAGQGEGFRFVASSGLKIDFDEHVPDADTLGLWHLHDGGCMGEGTGLEDASGGGHDFASYGAESVELGYSFDADAGAYLEAAYPGQPSRGDVTLETWIKGWQAPTGDWRMVADLAKEQANQFCIRGCRATNPDESFIDGFARRSDGEGGWDTAWVRWVCVEADTLLASGEWVHVAIVLDSGSVLRLYVNGVLRAAMSNAHGPLRDGDWSLWVGRSVSTNYYAGIVGEVRLSGMVRYASDFNPDRLLPQGVYRSPTFDGARRAARWLDLVRNSALPSGCGIAWSVRAADELDVEGHPQALWEAWDGPPTSLPTGRYLQWRATLTPDPDRHVSPTVESVTARADEAGYNVYHGTGAGPEAIAYDQPIARLGPGITSCETGALAALAIHWFGVRSVDGRGLETPTSQDEIRLELDAEGAPVPDRPGPPITLSADPVAGGRIRLVWRYRFVAGQATPGAFRIFSDAGTGTIDYASPLGEVPFGLGRQRYTWTSDPLTLEIPHTFAVRAVTAEGVLDRHEQAVQVTPDASVPGSVDALEAEVIL